MIAVHLSLFFYRLEEEKRKAQDPSEPQRMQALAILEGAINMLRCTDRAFALSSLATTRRAFYCSFLARSAERPGR